MNTHTMKSALRQTVPNAVSHATLIAAIATCYAFLVMPTMQLVEQAQLLSNSASVPYSSVPFKVTSKGFSNKSFGDVIFQSNGTATVGEATYAPIAEFKTAATPTNPVSTSNTTNSLILYSMQADKVNTVAIPSQPSLLYIQAKPDVTPTPAAIPVVTGMPNTTTTSIPLNTTEKTTPIATINTTSIEPKKSGPQSDPLTYVLTTPNENAPIKTENTENGVLQFLLPKSLVEDYGFFTTDKAFNGSAPVIDTNPGNPESIPSIAAEKTSGEINAQAVLAEQKAKALQAAIDASTVKLQEVTVALTTLDAQLKEAETNQKNAEITLKSTANALATLQTVTAMSGIGAPAQTAIAGIMTQLSLDGTKANESWKAANTSIANLTSKITALEAEKTNTESELTKQKVEQAAAGFSEKDKEHDSTENEDSSSSDSYTSPSSSSVNSYSYTSPSSSGIGHEAGNCETCKAQCGNKGVSCLDTCGDNYPGCM